ncbi:HigA family addiction module antitoxin [Methylosinus sp. KRF6]|uniref:HigA family addiction module antitoxin n=1 Tax=Methylosinus sp. KRF6 TaxID=2846853 RepID=UPI001C0AEE3F|nr:HigA family addiction module antitoxin [Methylosinus sp. KRF6]MBU3887206.1 HigA family addiction module antidote protein [Methylosinus sp. KRF6]
MVARTRRHEALEPATPGELLRAIVIPATGLSKTAVAEALGVSRQTLYDVLSGKQAVTPALALRLGKLFGDGPEPWLRMQQAHDVWRLSREMKDELAAIEPLDAA